MIYLSAQPAQFYFVWQLQVQLYNFQRLGINKKNIHVLLGYSQFNEIDERVLLFVKNSKELANFYFYEDRRPPNNYEPTIRPHIIKQHIHHFPNLVDEYIFYHDCDIIFRELPDFNKLTKKNTWYLSDTKDYISAEGITEISSQVFDKMLEIVGVNKKDIIKQKYTGGAQSLLKGTTYSFWDKVERDSNNLYNYLSKVIHDILEKYNDDINSKDQNKGYSLVQPWCADMWALLWNGILFGFEIRTDKELDFCWASHHIQEWKSRKILHNAGVTFSESQRLFYKGSFQNKSPFHNDFDFVDANCCSYKYVQEIKSAEIFYRISLIEVSFLIIVRIDSEERKENLLSVTKFIKKYFDTNIFIVEADSVQKIDNKDFEDFNYEFIFDENPVFNRSKYNNYLLHKSKTKIAVIQDTDMIVDVSQIISSVNLINKNKYHMVSPYDSFVPIESVEIKNNFLRHNDISILKYYSKSVKVDFYALGGMVVLDRNWFIKNGADNKYIEGYGPDDIERVIRTIIIGGKFKKIKGNIYHLCHPRNANSHYLSDTFLARFLPLMKILSMRKSILQKYITEYLL